MPTQQLVRRGRDLARTLWTLISARRPMRIAVGVVLLLIGIVGLFLPILQGVAIIVAALAILRQDIPLAERIWQRWVMPLQQYLQQWLHAYRERRARRQQPKS
ncbi:MAG TPA: PGPGW domain-containing protein [Candidatus Tectomicrobia bacterium]